MTSTNDLAKFFARFKFAPVLQLPPTYDVYDFTSGYDPERMRSSEYGVGRYNEHRPGMYATDLFTGGEQARDIHIGLDIAAPAGTPVFAFYEGRVLMSGVNSAPGDYGGTLITEHVLGERVLYALYGHLAPASLLATGTPVRASDVVARLGVREENGGWNPHLHFQLSWLKPERCDLPGVVKREGLAQALKDYPDPRLVVGALY